MGKTRSCRRTEDENKIHDKAVKMRKMTHIGFITCSGDYDFINHIISSGLYAILFSLCHSRDGKQATEQE